MSPLLRSAVGLLLGAVLCGLVIAAIESAGQLVYPFPADLNPQDTEAVREWMAHAPATVLLLVLLAWGLGTFAGAWLAAWVAGRARILHGLLIGGLFLLAAIANMLVIPHPLWVWVVGLSLFLPAAYAGARLAGGNPAAAEVEKSA